jgi:hypothetical protein
MTMAPHEFEFERWCGERIPIFPEPPLWHAMMRAKEAFLEGHAVQIRKEYIDNGFYDLGFYVEDEPNTPWPIP